MEGWRPAQAPVAEEAPAVPGTGADPWQVTDAEEVDFGGINIPVRGFEEEDDGFDYSGEDFAPENFMGTSLVATRFDPSQSVVIPTLPSGRTLVFNCVTTWGDQSFVGLAGIEIFDGQGLPVVLKDVFRQVTAQPSSINELPEYDCDPRTPDKLFDQVNLTRDDLHVWLAPFTPNQAHTVTVDFEGHVAISMIRIWNYNKSRLASSRGVKDLEILLDDQPIFVGEVRQAPGSLADPEQACEHILFTHDDSVLEAIEEHDWLPAHLPLEEGDEEGALGSGYQTLGDLSGLVRPPTGSSQTGHAMAPSPTTGVDGRPLTRASTNNVQVRAISCHSVTLVLNSTWGDNYYVGLTALELLDGSLNPIPIDASCIAASPSSLNDLEGVEGDPRTLDKLVDGEYCTSDEYHMWLAPFFKPPPPSADDEDQPTQRNVIRIDFGGARCDVAGFHIWNYNKCAEDTCRGVKEFSVYCDDRHIAVFLCRKAPGHVNFDFKQVVLLDQPPCADSSARRNDRLQLGIAARLSSAGSRGNSPGAVAHSASPRRRRTGSLERRLRQDSLRQDSLRQDSTGLPPASGAAGEKPGLRPAQVQQQLETPQEPCGFVFRFQLLCTWSDAHYIGLDGIELYDVSGYPLRPLRVHSNYGSVRDLPGMDNDIRTEENLLHGSPASGSRTWLSPFMRQPPNVVNLVFDEPTRISCVKFWNYSRTPSRGVRDLEMYVDDLLVYSGILRQENGSGFPARGEAVLFTSRPEIVERERQHVYLPSADELVAFFDERGRVDQRGRHGVPTPPDLRPMTALLG